MIRPNAAACLRGLGGAVLGGALGAVATRWLANNGGLYAIVLPGALVGLGWTLAARQGSVAAGLICAVLGLAQLYTEWWLMPFTADASLAYFLTHLADLGAVKWVLLLLGAGIAYWFAQGGGGRGPAEKES